ncbi:hypothetical protein AB0J80_34705 [Actinoplanes sp. NPDC049548]|uniref:hypothetical protein n=1 Tax=Actinoplanes sp. NPDC049548 TaxID=3155152 RepID=UPI00344721A7
MTNQRDERRRAGGARRLLIGTGALVIAYAISGAIADPDLKVGGVVLFLGAVLGLHDAVFMPLVLGAGALLTRSHPLVRAALIVSLAVTLVALPLVLGHGRDPDNPSALPLPYGRGLGAVLIAIWAPTLAFLALRRSGDRQQRWRRSNRQKTVRTRTLPPGPSDG